MPRFFPFKGRGVEELLSAAHDVKTVHVHIEAKSCKRM